MQTYTLPTLWLNSEYPGPSLRKPKKLSVSEAYDRSKTGQDDEQKNSTNKWSWSKPSAAKGLFELCSITYNSLYTKYTLTPAKMYRGEVGTAIIFELFDPNLG